MEDAMKAMLKTVALCALLTGFAARAEVDKKTERTWKAKCASCHAVDGTGQTDTGAKMGIGDYSKADWQASKTDDQLKKSIAEGIKRDKDGKQQEMDGFADKLDADQIGKLVQLIRSLKK
jgi:mono/diheme cytochrome c family protein